MDSVLYNIQSVSIGMLVLISLGAFVTILLIPKRIGFYLSLFLIGSWLNLSRFSDLALLSTMAKFTFMVPPLMLMYCASAIPGPRRPVPFVVWVYLICPIMGLFCIAGTTDKFQGIAQFGAMFFLAAGGITLYRVATNNQILIKSLSALFLGLLVPVAMGCFALLVYRSDSFRGGVNRFEPFGMLSNQYVQILASACCLAACGYLIIPKVWVKVLCLSVMGVCSVMVMYSGSRQGLFILVLSMLPAVWNIRRNPIAVGLGAVCCLGIAGYIFRYTDNVHNERITDFSNTSGRYEVAEQYLEVALSRPLAGLMGTRGTSVDIADGLSKVPHNSYLRMAYLGGALLVVPLFIAAVTTILSCIYVFRHRSRLNINHLVLSSLAALLLAVYAQGLVNDMIYMSSVTLPFMHFFISCFFIGTAQELKRQPAYSWQLNTARSMPATG